MRISYVTINRIAEQRAATDAEFRQTLERDGRAFLSTGRGMSDDALLAMLRSLGIDMDREVFQQTSAQFLSAEEMSGALVQAAGLTFSEKEGDWFWIALTCLWERWLPDRPSFEMIDDQMQAGYELQKQPDLAGACRLWLGTWKSILDIIEQRRIRSIDEFDDRFAGTQSLFNASSAEFVGKFRLW